MQVLNFHSDAFPGTTVGVFVYEPFDFLHEYDIALRGELLPGLHVHFVSINTLIRMKQASGRPRDLDDIQLLEWLQDDRDELQPAPHRLAQDHL